MLIGAWRSLVAHLHGVQGVGGSNPLAPIPLAILRKNTSASITAATFNHSEDGQCHDQGRGLFPAYTNATLQSLPAKGASNGRDNHLSLSRLNHGQPGVQAHPEIVQGTVRFHHEITDASLPQTDPVFDNAAALDTTVHMLDPQP